MFDVSPLIDKGEFKILNDKDFYYNRCTVLNKTLAWNVSGNFDKTSCLDIDRLEIYLNFPNADESI